METENKEVPTTGTENKNCGTGNTNPPADNQQKKGGKWDPKKHFKKKAGFESSSKAKFPKLNHVQWYVLDKAMMDNIGSYPFGYPIGGPVFEGKLQMPTAGIAVIRYCPAIPGDGKAWRTAATRFETTVRAKNSRSATYTGNDLLMSQCCYASVYSAYAYLIKHFGLLKMYSYKNDYLTQCLVTSLGCDYRDLSNNQANYRDRVNQLGRDLMSLLFIKGMTLFERWSFLNLNLFTDTESAKTQVYQFKPTCVWKWTPKSSTLGSSLTGVEIPETYKLQDLIDLISDCVESLRGDDDIKYMNADIAKAYPNNEVVTIKPVEENFTLDLVGNSNIKDQIQNARIVGIRRSDIVPTDITNSAEMKFYLEDLSEDIKTLDLFNAALKQSTIITTDDVNPTSEDVIVKSRFMNTLYLNVYDNTVLSGASGSEVIHSIYYVTDATDKARHVELLANGIAVTRDTTGAVVETHNLDTFEIVKINSYRWHPYYIVGDMREYPTDNFVVLGEENLNYMNSSIAKAMLNIVPAANTGVTNM